MKLGEVIADMRMGATTSLTFMKIRIKKQKSFINSPFFCSEFQSVSRIMKVVRSECYVLPDPKFRFSTLEDY